MLCQQVGGESESESEISLWTIRTAWLQQQTKRRMDLYQQSTSYELIRDTRVLLQADRVILYRADDASNCERLHF